MGLRNKNNRAHSDTEVVLQAESARRGISVTRIAIRSLLFVAIIGVGSQMLGQDGSESHPGASEEAISEEYPVADYTFSDIAKDAALYDPAIPKSQTSLWVDTASGGKCIIGIENFVVDQTITGSLNDAGGTGCDKDDVIRTRLPKELGDSLSSQREKLRRFQKQVDDVVRNNPGGPVSIYSKGEPWGTKDTARMGSVSSMIGTLQEGDTLEYIPLDGSTDTCRLGSNDKIMNVGTFRSDVTGEPVDVGVSLEDNNPKFAACSRGNVIVIPHTT